MMRLLIVLLTLIGIAAATVGAVWLAENPGEVSVQWQGWNISVSVGVFVGLLIALFALIAIFWRVLRGILTSPGRLVGYYRHRRHEAGNLALLQGMAAVAIQDRREALRQAKIARDKLVDPVHAAQLSAQAALLTGDRSTARRHFETLSNKHQTTVVGLMGLMSLALEDGDRKTALAHAERAYRLRPDLQSVAQQLLDLQIAEGKWADAVGVLQEAMKVGTIDKAEGRGRMAVFQLMLAAQARDGGDGTAALAHAKRAHAADPSLVPAVIAYARQLRHEGKQRKATGLIEQAWRSAQHPDLAQTYLELAPPGTSSLDQFKRIQKLVSSEPLAHESRIALARAALAADLWDEARSQLEVLAGDEPTATVCRLMADLELAEHGDSRSAADWLTRAATAPVDPAWVCERCGAVAPDWEAHCGNCGAFDTIGWRTPPRVVRLEPHGALPAAESETEEHEPAAVPAPQGTAPPPMAADA